MVFHTLWIMQQIKVSYKNLRGKAGFIILVPQELRSNQ